MSFSSEVKMEICKNELLTCCEKAQLAALLQLNGSLTISNQQQYIAFRIGNPTIAKRMLVLLKKNYSMKTQLAVIKQMQFKKNNVYEIKIFGNITEMLEDLTLLDQGLVKHPKASLLKKDCCVRAYIAGCFLACGSVNSPKTSNYHLEMTFLETDIASFVLRLINRYDLNAKTIIRRNRYIVYLKNSEKIGDFFRIIGTSEGLMNFENFRIDRDFTNNVARLNNCDIANSVKAQIAAKKQWMEIKLIEQTVGLDKLEKKLEEVAILRLENSEDSLKELCDLYYKKYHQQMSKSGLRHRFNKISDVASRLVVKV